MDYIELKCQINPFNQRFSEALTAKLSHMDFEGFMEIEGGFTAYIQASAFNMGKVEELNFPHFANCELNYSYKLIQSQNWNTVWESNFNPIVLANQLLIRASFHVNMPSFPYEIVIDPKMSFGTGHHATTSLMAESILETELEEKKVLDMGCGTGILAILCSKMKASKIHAIDIDEWSYKNALENVKNNNAKNISVFLGDVNLLKNKTYDLILANINRNILLHDMKFYTSCLTENGELIMSGFYAKDFPFIEKEAQRNGLKNVKQKTKNNWVAAKFRKNN